MAGSVELPEDQRRTLDRLKPASEKLGLYLAGGTAIAIHLGHRVSRDFDLFGRDTKLDLEQVRAKLTELSNSEVTSIRFGVKESDIYHVIRSLTFFDDAEADALMPDGLSPEHWGKIKRWFAENAPRALR